MCRGEIPTPRADGMDFAIAMIVPSGQVYFRGSRAVGTERAIAESGPTARVYFRGSRVDGMVRAIAMIVPSTRRRTNVRMQHNDVNERSYAT